MNVQLQQLISLQEIDSEIAELNKCIEVIPEQIASGEKELAEKKDKLTAAQEEIESLIKNRHQIEQDVQIENDHIAKTKGKLTLVKTNKEYTAILHEVDAVKKKITALEEMGTTLKEALAKNINPDTITVERVEMVGPKVGKDLREKAMLSILYAIIGIVIYISWRF